MALTLPCARLRFRTKIHPQLQQVGRRGSFADRAQPRTRVGNLVDKHAHHRFAKGPETFMTE
jgi:hypothetical protein